MCYRTYELRTSTFAPRRRRRKKLRCIADGSGGKKRNINIVGTYFAIWNTWYQRALCDLLLNSQYTHNVYQRDRHDLRNIIKKSKSAVRFYYELDGVAIDFWVTGHHWKLLQKNLSRLFKNTWIRFVQTGNLIFYWNLFITWYSLLVLKEFWEIIANK